MRMSESQKTTTSAQSTILTPQTVTVKLTNQQLTNINDASIFLEVANNINISSIGGFEIAALNLREVMSGKKKVNATRLDLTRPLDDTKKKIIQSVAPIIAQYDECIKIYKSKMHTFSVKMENKRKKEEAQKQEVARKEFERLQKRAKTADSTGKTETAEVLREQAESIPAPIVVSKVAKVSGISTRTTWYAEVTNKQELVKAIADGRAPLNLVSVNVTTLNKLAIALKQEFRIPGVVAKSKSDITARL